MSSSRGTSNSNKTAHVMNLLRKNTPQPPSDPVDAEHPPVAATPASTSASASTSAPAPQTPPIITALHADAEVSSQIRDALTEALEQEESLSSQQQASLVPHPAAAPAPDITADPPAPILEEASPSDFVEASPAEMFSHPAPAPETVSVQAPEVAPAVPQPPVPETAQKPEVLPAEKTPETVPDAPAQDVSSAAEPPADDAILINIMERLAEEKADKYIHLFGLCTCQRCRKDVIALALNTLPAQYAVMPEWEYSIRADMYAKRYSSDLTAELLRACKVVMDNPRHQIS